MDTVGDYKIARELGQGGMGKVFLATAPDGKSVALKTMVFPANLDARARWETVERFQREARAARSLEHPGICQVLDIGADEETYFIVMEYCAGHDLRQQIDESGAMPVPRCLEVMRQVCEALAYAHDQGIIHRDIKPDNIMLLQDGSAKLMDFGLASIVHETGLTQTGVTLGTLFYMSPEQARGEKLDARSDIFSFGATFYEMLTGRRAFDGDAPGAIINEVLNKEVELPASLPLEVSRALGRCLRKRANHRFQNVRELIFALDLAAGSPAVGGTVVLPTSPAAAAPPASAPPAARAPSAPRAGSTLSGASAARTAPGASAPESQCPKCREPMAANTAACWRCGTPNPAISQRKSRSDSRSAIQSAVQDFGRKKKRGWFRRG
jgi:serine/threonine protein kinase